VLLVSGPDGAGSNLRSDKFLAYIFCMGVHGPVQEVGWLGLRGEVVSRRGVAADFRLAFSFHVWRQDFTRVFSFRAWLRLLAPCFFLVDSHAPASWL
jgi:hypothetical protein